MLIFYLLKITRLVSYSIALFFGLVVTMWQVSYKRGNVLDKKTKLLRSGIAGLFTMLLPVLAF